MGKQSSRIYFQGKDHKDIWFKGNYHNSMYIGSQLVWKKIIEKYCVISGMICNLINGRKINPNGRFYVKKSTPNFSIGEYRDDEGNKYLAITKDLLYWKRIREVDASKTYYISATEEGFFIYLVGEGIYYLKIIKDLKYSISKIRSTIFGSYISHNLYGISDYFYYITLQYVDSELTYILHKVSQSGNTESGKLGGYFANTYAQNTEYSKIAVVSEILYIVADGYLTSATNKGTRILKIRDMDLDSIYTELFIGENNSYFDDYGSVEVVYDGYQVVYLATNRGGNNYVGGYSYKYKYAKMRYYVINPIGTLGLVKEITNRENLVIPFKIGPLNRELVISFTENGEEGEDQYYVNCKDLRWDSSEDIKLDGFPSTSLVINSGTRNQQCLIPKWGSMKAVIYIDNLFWEDSENNFAIKYD